MDVKVIARQSLMHGRLNLRKGEVVEIPEAVAAELERVSLVKRVETEPVAPAAPAKASTASTRASRSKKDQAPATGAQTPAPAGDAKPNAPVEGGNAGNLTDTAQDGQTGTPAGVVQTSAQAAATGDQASPVGAKEDADPDAGAGSGEEG